VNPVAVAAAVIERPDGSFLLAKRPPGKPYPGYWEFPGGKIEAGESPCAALKRELYEELGIEVQRAYPWLTRLYHYSHAHVRLNFIRVAGWTGEPAAREGQRLSWQRPGNPTVAPMLPANAPILKALELPLEYAITDAGAFGIDSMLREVRRALDCGVRLMQIREHSMDPAALEVFAGAVMKAAQASDARVLVNGDEALARRIGAHGLHLTARRLKQTTRRPEFDWCAASCHDESELDKAAQLDLDFAVLGPIRPTPSHPHVAALGWQRFVQLVRGYPLPVFALGGLEKQDLEQARSHGAHGIAMIRGAWR
jgi:8-oxo-dGTP diphosphatase